MNRQKSFENERPTLYLVATPIGNLDEMTYRSINTLKNVKYIAAEDTRNTVKLLNHFEISTKLISHHEHNIKQSIPKLIQLLEEGNDIALVSDAGYPAISDPGYELVKEAIEHEINVVPTFDDAKNSFELDLSSLIDDTNSNAGKDVTITYDVLVTSENDKVTNTANVSRTGSENYSSDSVDLYEGAITLTKTNDYEKESDKKLLAGAGFNVLDKDGNVLKFVDKGNNNYVLAKDQTVTTGVVTEVVTGANGQLVVKGLDKGKYQFKEVTAPEGYSINETNSSATLTITGDKATAEFTADADMRDTEVGALPETGGIGTTIFTVGGCAIMVAAAALFFMNKKKHEK